MSLYDKLNKPTSGLSAITAGTTDANQNTNMKGFGNKIQAGDELLGRKVTKLSLELKNNGSAVGGTITFGVFNTNSATPVFTFGTFSASELTSSYQYFEEENLTGHTLTADQVLGFHASGDISNLQLRRYNGGTGGRPTVYAMYWATSTSPNWQNAGDHQDANMKVNYIIPSVKVSGATYTGDYSSTSGWTQATTNTANSGTGAQTVGIDGGWAYANSTGSANGQFVYTSLGITLSDTKWVADFEYYNIGAINLYPFVLASGTSSSWNSTQDMISVIEGGTNVLMIRYRDGSSQANSSASSAMSTNTSYFCRLIRDGQVLTLKMYTDSARTSQHGSDMTVTISGSVTGLTTLHHSGITGGGATSGYYFKVRGTKIYNNSTSAIPDSEVGILRQRFVETFSADALDTDRWDIGYNSGNVPNGMSDEINGGFFIKTTNSWDQVRLDWNNKRQFSPTTSKFIASMKYTNSASASAGGAGLIEDKTSAELVSNNGVGWSLSANNSYFNTGDGTNRQVNTTGATIDNNFHTYTGELNGTNAKGSIDGILKATNSTHIPQASSKLQPSVWHKSGDETFNINYYEAYNS